MPSLLPGPALAAAAVAGMRGVPVSCPWCQAVPSLLAGQPGVLPAAAALPAALPAAAWPPAAVGERGAPASALAWPTHAAGKVSVPWGSQCHGGEQRGGMTGRNQRSWGRKVRGTPAAAPSWGRLKAHGHGARGGQILVGAASRSGVGARRWHAGRSQHGDHTPCGAGARGVGGSHRAATGLHRGARHNRGRCA